jgi:hypothetical protein
MTLQDMMNQSVAARPNKSEPARTPEMQEWLDSLPRPGSCQCCSDDTKELQFLSHIAYRYGLHSFCSGVCLEEWLEEKKRAT